MLELNELRSRLEDLISDNGRGSGSPAVLGKPTEFLARCGASVEQSITITKKVLVKAMRPEIRDVNGRLVGNTGHGLNLDMIVYAIVELDNPLMVFKGNNANSLLIITSVQDTQNRNIVIAIELKRKEAFAEVNSIRSIYGRDNLAFYIGDNIEKGNLMLINKEKADGLLRSIGKSYPKENTIINLV